MDLGPDHFSITSDLEGIPTWQDSDWEPIFYTLIWLTQEGYIRTHGYSHGICQGAVLTQKGLAVLRSIPDSVSGTAPIGEQLSSAVTSGAKDVARGLVEQALSAGIKIILGQ